MVRVQKAALAPSSQSLSVGLCRVHGPEGPLLEPSPHARAPFECFEGLGGAGWYSREQGLLGYHGL